MSDVIVVLFRSVLTAAALGLFQSTTSSTPYYIASTESYDAAGGSYACVIVRFTIVVQQIITLRPKLSGAVYCNRS